MSNLTARQRLENLKDAFLENDIPWPFEPEGPRMKFVWMTNTARAQIQCCGVWLQARGTIIGAFPNWWFDPNNARHAPRAKHPFRLGLTLWALDHSGGVHTVFGIETRNRRIKYSRAFAKVSEGHDVGWSTWRRST